MPQAISDILKLVPTIFAFVKTAIQLWMQIQSLKRPDERYAAMGKLRTAGQKICNGIACPPALKK